MRIGYACQTLGIPGAVYRGCTLRNASPAILAERTRQNLDLLLRAIHYNIRQEIRLFRITSDLVPFGSSSANTLDWPELFAAELAEIGSLIRAAGMRVSLHPGQYTVLNSPRPEVVRRATDDLLYHCRILDGLGLGPEHKIVLHIGGIYGDKAQATQRFLTSFGALDPLLRRRLVLENDERCYTVSDVLAIAGQVSAPVVFDNLHHALNPPPEQNDGTAAPDAGAWIAACRPTWRPEDGPQKIHYAQQDPAGKPGAHARTIEVEPFLAFCADLPDAGLDIMLEVKDKDLSARKCLVCASALPRPGRWRQALESEWARYKYIILERSPADYLAIRRLLADQTADNRTTFYEIVARALRQTATPGTLENAALHVWGYFKNQADETEKRQFQHLLAPLREGRTSGAPVKRFLWRLTEKYQQPYLLDSLYFADLPGPRALA
jgi:UV DNA damage endonuclease